VCVCVCVCVCVFNDSVWLIYRLFAVQQELGVREKTRGTVLLRYNQIGSFTLTVKFLVLLSKPAGEFHADCEVPFVTEQGGW
jgi:hypothetical protein